MATDKLENCAQYCFNKFDCWLFISKFIEIGFYLSLSPSVISKSLAQPWYKCCSLSVSIVTIGNPERHVRKASHRGSKQQ